MLSPGLHLHSRSCHQKKVNVGATHGQKKTMLDVSSLSLGQRAVTIERPCCAGTVNNTTTAMVLYSDNNESVEWINMCWRKVRACLFVF